MITCEWSGTVLTDEAGDLHTVTDGPCGSFGAHRVLDATRTVRTLCGEHLRTVLHNVPVECQWGTFDMQNVDDGSVLIGAVRCGSRATDTLMDRTGARRLLCRGHLDYVIRIKGEDKIVRLPPAPLG